MIPILVHFLGGLYVDSAIPPYIEAVDSYFLSMWYLAFAAVDLIAACLAKNPRVRMILSLSMSWSLCLSVEQLLFIDYFQRNDWIVQILIDGALLVYLLLNFMKPTTPMRTSR